MCGKERLMLLAGQVKVMHMSRLSENVMTPSRFMKKRVYVVWLGLSGARYTRLYPKLQTPKP